MNSTTEEKLNNFRIQIDEIDNQLLEFLIKRTEIGKEIVEIKSELGLPPKDDQREKEILDRVVHLTEGTIEREEIVRIFSEIIRATRRSQKHQSRKLDEEK